MSLFGDGQTFGPSANWNFTRDVIGKVGRGERTGTDRVHVLPRTLEVVPLSLLVIPSIKGEPQSPFWYTRVETQR